MSFSQVNLIIMKQKLILERWSRLEPVLSLLENKINKTAHFKETRTDFKLSPWCIGKEISEPGADTPVYNPSM